MRWKLFPLLASLAVCAATAAAVVATTAHAQPGNVPPHLATLVSPAPGGDAHPAAPPAQAAAMCRDLYARQAGALAYMGARLNLTPAQQPLFERWQKTRLDAARRRQNQCGSTERGKTDGMVARMTREEDRLKTRLADLSAERPVLEALYSSLTPRQKRDFRPGDPDARPAMMRRRMFASTMPGAHPMPPQGPPPGALSP